MMSAVEEEEEDEEEEDNSIVRIDVVRGGGEVRRGEGSAWGSTWLGLRDERRRRGVAWQGKARDGSGRRDLWGDGKACR